MKNVRAFAMVTEPGLHSQLIIHWESGYDTIAEMGYDELKDLVFLTTAAFEQMNKECADDYAAEQQAYQRGLELQESAAEAEFSRRGYDDVPF